MIDLPKPVLYAHRGACAHAPENTLAAFQLAFEQGANGIELDAKLSADCHVMVIHDQTVDRTTNGRGKVGELTLAELKTLDAGTKFSPQFAGEPIPTLEEVFAAFGKRLLINVELTNYASVTDALVPKVVELVQRYELHEWVLFSSFHPLNLWRAQRMLPDVPRGFLLLPGKACMLAYRLMGRLLSFDYSHPYYSDVDRNYVDAQRRRNHGVNVWTVDDPDEMRRLAELGIDGIITDDPQLARQALEVT